MLKKSMGGFLVFLIILSIGRSLSIASTENLNFYAERGDISNVQRLILAGADVNAADNDGATALMSASIDGHHETVKLLLAADANVNASGNNPFTPLSHPGFSRDFLV